MAIRPVFVVKNTKPFFKAVEIEFTYNCGMAASQKKKNIAAIHQTFRRKFPESEVLEISSKSMQEIGTKLSAFSMKLFVPSLGEKIFVENAYQGGKKYIYGGPYTDLYAASPKDAKRDSRHGESGRLTAYYFEGEEFPLIPTGAFYDWLYIMALEQNPELAGELMKYDAFTDIEFNPNKSSNCQARAAAVYVSLKRAGMITKDFTYWDLVKLIKG